MSLEGCLKLAVNASKLTRERADELLDKAKGFAKEKLDADKKAIDWALNESSIKRRHAAMQILAKIDAVGKQAQHSKGKSTGLNTLMGRDIGREATWENIDQMGEAIRSDFLRSMVDAIDAMRTKMFGLTQDTAIARDLVRGIHAEKVSDPIVNKLAKQVQDVFERARVMFNDAGGHILKRQNWFPVAHNGRLVSRAADVLDQPGKSGKVAWSNYVLPLLKREFMTDDTGALMTDKQLLQALSDVYDSITTDGMIGMDVLKHTGTKLANRHRDQRFLIFKDADSWLDYNNKFGNPNLLASITDYVGNISHEIALLKVFGPNPADTYKTLRALAEVDVKKRGDSMTRLGGNDALWNVVSGHAESALNLRFAEFASDVRNVTTSTRLGSAMISAVSDFAFMQHTAQWTDLSYTRVMSNYTKLLNPANHADRLEAARSLGIVENWITRALAANRFSEVTGSGWSAILADLTVRISGLSHHTNVAQQAVGLEVLTTLAEHVGKKMDDVPSQFPLRRFMTESEWDILRATPVEQSQFGKQIKLDTLLARTDISEAVKRDITRKTLEFTKDVANMAVPMPDARSRAITTGGLQRGTPAGETFRTIAQFKGFPISVLLQHGYAGMAQASRLGRMRYLGQLMVTTTVMGALALHLKEISKGRDALPMDNATFWVRAWTQGGGLGLYGDFIKAGLYGSNRFGENLITSLLGPTAGTVNDIVGLTFGQLGEVIEGKPNNFGADAAFVVERYTPVLSSLWYARLAFERMVVDSLRHGVDPDAMAKDMRKQQRLRRETEQGYWWKPGATSPHRLPEIL
jgi:hypothetical protein